MHKVFHVFWVLTPASLAGFWEPFTGLPLKPYWESDSCLNPCLFLCVSDVLLLRTPRRQGEEVRHVYRVPFRGSAQKIFGWIKENVNGRVFFLQGLTQLWNSWSIFLCAEWMWILEYGRPRLIFELHFLGQIISPLSFSLSIHVIDNNNSRHILSACYGSVILLNTLCVIIYIILTVALLLLVFLVYKCLCFINYFVK